MHGAHHGEIRNTSLHLPSSHLCCTDDPCWVWVFEAALQVPSVQQYLPIAHPAELPEPHMQVVVIAVSSAAVQVDPWLVDPWVCFGSALQVLSVQQYLSISHACVVPDTPQSQAKVSLSVSLFVHRFSFWSPSPWLVDPWFCFGFSLQTLFVQQYLPIAHNVGVFPVEPQLQAKVIAVSSAAVQVDPWLVDPWVCFGSALQVLSVQQYLSISHACVVPDTPQSQAKVSLSVSLCVHRFSFWSPSPFPSPWPFACLAQVPSPQQKYPAGHASGSVPSVGPQLHRFWTAVSSLLTVQIGGFGGTVNTIVTIGAPCIESESNHTFMQRKSPYPSPLHATLGLRCEDNR